MIVVGTSIYPNIMTTTPDLDPHEADRKYAVIAIACVKYVRNRTATGLWQLRTELEINIEDFDNAIQWLEDNAQ